MRRSITDSLIILWKSLTGSSDPKVTTDARVNSAKMSHTRLKALERPDYLKPQPPVPAAPDSSDLPDGEFLNAIGSHDPKMRPSLATVSHYRLAAYVATLPEEEQAKVKDQLSDTPT